ncbi:hypothetical protein SERLA73DRAFT_190626 [Serpula lacrymans var. lacrymans S7.3]|uniref:Uncharacterized protein n=2 Tax=Serpula lacrymans var. lacrymans TaxID=341189 RepID=F8QG23_SERL3|nr:uncharacterized protein SERLADRAFT_463500 [Serpula lacrymans var. lacrymans S7.9]EGN92771.1 hypothetical protein SERLA73DRAFT_190626 [Serpula lacrymans var. lacrymans S7.3]EGO26432.1 hypothetical protein SERLADRAFT_463500 [Serpula lacrymans var. lacrymans S7.9]
MNEHAERDKSFYFNDDVIFLVGGSLFKIPRKPFEEGSEVFRDMFQLPVSAGCAAEGHDDSNPIRLEGIEKEEFKYFLKVMFPAPEFSEVSLTEWTSVLKLSKLWAFDAMRERAINVMSTIAIPCAMKASLAINYNVDKWLLPALNDLAKRKEPISIEDVELLGVQVALKMAAVRESVKASDYQPKNGPIRSGYLLVGERDAKYVNFTHSIMVVLESELREWQHHATP